MARFRVIRIGALLIAFIVPATGSVSSAGFPCTDVLRMHGMLRKAAVTCGFSAYNPAIVDQAHACSDTLGSHQGAAEMHAGAAQFERMLSLRSNEAVCTTLARVFLMVVRPRPQIGRAARTG